MKRWFLLIFLIPNLSAAQWSRQNLYKYRYRQFKEIVDGEAFVADSDQISFEKGGWIRTAPLYIGEDFILDELFINSDGKFKIRVRDALDQSILFEWENAQSGAKRVDRILSKHFYLQLIALSSAAKLYSFGVKRIPLEIIRKEDLSLNTSILFFGEEALKITFRTRYPSEVDLLIFNSEGEIVRRLFKNRFYEEGKHSALWQPSESDPDLVSGNYVVYLIARSGAFKQEVGAFFHFVNR